MLPSTEIEIKSEKPEKAEKVEEILFVLRREWRLGNIVFNIQQEILFKAIIKGRDIKNSQVLSEALWIVFYGTDYSKFEEELAWWNPIKF